MICEAGHSIKTDFIIALRMTTPSHRHFFVLEVHVHDGSMAGPTVRTGPIAKIWVAERFDHCEIQSSKGNAALQNQRSFSQAVQ